MDNCACAWERVWFFGKWMFTQIAWCRAHMEAEIAKQAIVEPRQGGLM